MVELKLEKKKDHTLVAFNGVLVSLHIMNQVSENPWSFLFFDNHQSIIAQHPTQIFSYRQQFVKNLRQMKEKTNQWAIISSLFLFKYTK